MSIVIFLIWVVVLVALFYLLVRPVIRGAIFFTTSDRNIGVMLDMVSLRPGDRIVDLGSGDGRVLIACARRGIRAEGYEINPLLVFLSRRAIRGAGMQGLALVHWKSFWRTDLSRFDAVFVFGISRIMNGLRKKMEQELRPGTKVASNLFSFHGWIPAAKRDGVYLYLMRL
jgi:precorrin-6B methylase 2